MKSNVRKAAIATATGIGVVAAFVFWGTSPTYYPNGLVITTPNVVISNADISNPNGVGLIIRAEGVVVDNVRVHDSKSHGILIQASNVTVKNSLVEDNVLGTCYPGCSGGWESGIKCQSKDGGTGLVRNVKLLNNVVRHNLGEGFGLRCADLLVQGNTVYDNFSYNIYFNSWDITVERNFVYCTGDSKFYRDGKPAAGIGGQEEGFTNWPKSAHDILVQNNIVSNCKYGYRYGGAGGGPDPGLVRATIQNNTFYQTVSGEISIAYAPAQKDVLIRDNIARRVSFNPSGVISTNNLDVKLVSGLDPYLFLPPVNLQGGENVLVDFFGKERVFFTVGAIEWKNTSSSTSTSTSTSIPVPTSTATVIIQPSFTPTPSFFCSALDIYFENSELEQCIRLKR